MSKFKVGDRVRFAQKSPGTARTYLVGSEFALGDYAGSWDGEDTWSANPSNGYRFKASELELVHPASPSPVITKTVKEIVRGTYGPVEVGGQTRYVSCVPVVDVRLDPTNAWERMGANSLREASRIFLELADALEA